MFYEISKAVLSPVLHGYFDIETKGLENVPGDGPAILAANHLSFLDSFFIPLVVDRRVTYVAKAEYFDHWYSRIFFKSWGQIPIKRDGGEASENALEAAAEVLDRGELFGIYPEGTRSPDGNLHKGHTGVARLALRSGAPVIPVGVAGTREVLPKGKKMPNRGQVEVRFGTPMDFASRHKSKSERLLLRSITDEVMFEIAALSGQEYLDSYSNQANAHTAALEDFAESRIRMAEVEPSKAEDDPSDLAATG